VHGGVIALLVLLLAGHVVLRSLLRSATVPVTVAVTAFGGGCVLMTASLVLDGFVTPAHALHYRAAQELTAQQSIEGLVGFCATGIGILMPLALLSFAVSALVWCVPLLRSHGRYRIAGAASCVIGGLIGIMMSTVAPGLLDHALLASLFLVASWHLVLAFGVLQGTYRPESAPRASFDGDPDGTARSSIASLQIMPVCWPGRRPR